MSEKTVTTKLSQHYIVADPSSKQWGTPDAYFYIGGSGSYYYTYYLKLTTPYFSGTSKNIKIQLKLFQSWTSDNNIDIPIRFALSKSDSNRDAYRNTASSVTDEHQVATGVWIIPSVQYNSSGKIYECVINSSDLEPNTTYYFFMWAYRIGNNVCGEVRSHNNYLSSASAIVTFYDHVAHIDTGSTIKSCQCYIDNGVSWIPIIPHIDNGSEWKPCI